MEMNRHTPPTSPSTIAPAGSIQCDSSQRLEGFSLSRVSGIYKFQHKESGKIYIGSSVDIWRRKNAHLSASKRGSVSCLHRALREHGLDAFCFGIVEPCGRGTMLAREEYYIRLYRCAGVNGYNTLDKTSAGRYGLAVSQATKDRIGAAHKGKKVTHSAESRLRMSKSRRGRKRKPHSAQTRDKLRAAQKGRKHSDETRERMSRAGKGRPKSDETRARMSAWQIGLKHSPERIANMAAGHAKAIAARAARRLPVLHAVQIALPL